MNKFVKILIMTVATLSILAVAGWYILLHIVGGAFGSKCEEKNVWKIEGYTIVEHQCLGWAGPYYYPSDLYKNGKKIGRRAYRQDSCFFKFILNETDTLNFNICEMALDRNKK